MKLHKRKRQTRNRGTRTHGWAMKKHKGGKGNQGGKGMSGTGKRGDQKKTFVIKNLYPYFGKKGFTSRGTARVKNNVYNLDDLQTMIITGRAKNSTIILKDYKILGDGEIRDKINITARAFSKSAKEKIEAAGGQTIVYEVPSKKEPREKKAPAAAAVKEKKK